MKVKFFTLLSSVLVSGLLYAQDIQVTDKWQLLGALEDISSSSFDEKCVDFIWKYDNGWQVHIANGNRYNLPSNITQFDTIHKGQGFWIKGNSSCDVNETSSNISNLKFTYQYLNGKVLYNVYKDHDDDNNNNNTNEFVGATFKFTSSTFKAEQGIVDNPSKVSGNYSINEKGYIIFNDEMGNSGVRLLKKDNDKLTVCWSDRINELDDDTCWGGEEYFFFDKQKAKDFVNAKNAEILANSEKVTISGKVTFKDSNGNIISIPDDARIRITSDTDQNNHKWENGFNIDINDNGTFNKTKMQYKNTYKEGHTFQVVVYKNHIKTEENMWDCGEDVYKYVGNDVSFGNWQNIIVTPQDYQDRSNETCND